MLIIKKMHYKMIIWEAILALSATVVFITITIFSTAVYGISMTYGAISTFILRVTPSIEAPAGSADIWVLRFALGLAIIILGFWLVRFIKSVDVLTTAVNNLGTVVKGMKIEFKGVLDDLKENKESHKLFHKKINEIEKDIIKLKRDD